MAIPTLNHQTKNEFLARFRIRYREAEREDKWRLAHKLQGWIDAEWIGRAKIKEIWNFETNAEADAFMARIANKAAKWDDLQSETAGE